MDPWEIYYLSQGQGGLMKNSVDKVFGVNLPDCLGVEMEISKPLPAQATIPRKSIQKEFTNERTY